MKKLVLTLMMLCLSLPVVQAQAITLSLDPNPSSVNVGDSFLVNMNISGLGGLSPNLGGFFVDIRFDSTLFSLNSVTFGSHLGDIVSGEADADSDSSIPGALFLDETSFLLSGDLIQNQPSLFTLATLSFTGLSAGSGWFGFDYADLSDTDGNPLFYETILGAQVDVNAAPAPVPEPGTLGLLGLGLAGLFVARRRQGHRNQTELHRLHCDQPAHNCTH